MSVIEYFLIFGWSSSISVLVNLQHQIQSNCDKILYVIFMLCHFKNFYIKHFETILLLWFSCFNVIISVTVVSFVVMVFNATFNNISVISWRSVLLVEETTDLPQVTNKLYHIMLVVASTPLMSRNWTHNVSDYRHCLQR